MRLFDTHTHILDKRFDKDRPELIKTLPESGLIGMIECATDEKTSKKAAELARNTEYIYAAVGVHPHDAANVSPNYIDKIETLAANRKVIAIGEIGLDYHYDFSPRDIQKRVFEEQLILAKKLGLPVALHMRESTHDMMSILKEHKGLKGVMHCFSGSAETAKLCIELGLCISFTGTVTFKNAKKTIDAANAVPLGSLMAETDCPYLSPEPVRGKRNNPANVRYVLQKLAEIKGIGFEEMCEANLQNAKELYGI